MSSREFKGTPGPWVDNNGLICSDTECVAVIPQGRYPGIIGQSNAKLLSSSYELLKALEGLRGCISETRGKDAHSALIATDAAIAKAYGESEE